LFDIALSCSARCCAMLSIAVPGPGVARRGCRCGNTSFASGTLTSFFPSMLTGAF
jgi:hypothetical protein